MSLKPRPEYTPDELAQLYPPPLRLQQVQVLLRHGERTPVVNRFAHIGLPEFWPYCAAVSRIASPILDTSSSTWTTLNWRRRLETFTAPNDQSPRLGAAAGRTSDHPSDGICELGQLTDKGRQTTTALGCRLRRLYVDQLRFLPGALGGAGADIGMDNLYLRSTPMSRTLESVQQAFHGLYPPEARSTALGPVTIHLRHWADETLLPNTTNCPRLAQLVRAFSRRAAERWDNSPDMNRINAKLEKYMPKKRPSSSSSAVPSSSPPVSSSLFRSKSDSSGDKVRIGVASHPALVGVLDTIAASAAHDGAATKLPAEFYDAGLIADTKRIVGDEWFGGFRDNAEYRTLGIGGLLADMTERMVDSAQGREDVPLKFALSGCHDTTIGATVLSLGGGGQENEKGTLTTANQSSSSSSSIGGGHYFLWPPFTSHVAVELLRDEEVVNGDERARASAASRRIGRRPSHELTSEERDSLRGYYVRVRYNDEPITIPGCRPTGKHYGHDESLCTLTAFKSVVDRITPTNWKAQCVDNLNKPVVPDRSEPAGYSE